MSLLCYISTLGFDQYTMIHFHMIYLIVGRRDFLVLYFISVDISFITGDWLGFYPVLFYISVDLQFRTGSIHVYCSFYISYFMYS